MYDPCIRRINTSLVLTRVATNYVNFLWNFSTVERCATFPVTDYFHANVYSNEEGIEIPIKLRFQRMLFLLLERPRHELSYGTNVVEDICDHSRSGNLFV